MTFPYAAQNAAQRERLRAVVARLSDADLARMVDAEWTVAQVLVHLAFWDRYREAAFVQWEGGGDIPTPVEAEALNTAIAVLSEAIPPRESGRLAVEAAEAIDRVLERLPADKVAAAEAAGLTLLLNRSQHRGNHLNQIERALG
ncbi:MAG TPA: maleylpyruvate isomerase N-terminal domain-containing protein [Aggregatilineaceae bacterium]|nr:maleylpyruvate isomerase N-terminal domain-containing protein [Aggregatilineaceae bacterium]